MSLTSYRTAPPRVSDLPRLLASSFRLVFSPSRVPADPTAGGDRAGHSHRPHHRPRERSSVTRRNLLIRAAGRRSQARAPPSAGHHEIRFSGIDRRCRTSSQATRPVRLRNGPGLGRPGGDLLSHALRRSTIGAEGFHGRVRDGIGCFTPRHSHQAIQSRSAIASSLHLFIRGSFAFRGSSSIVSDLFLIAFQGLLRTRSCPADAAAQDLCGPARDGGEVKPIERLVPVSFMCCHTSTPGLSTWWSSTALKRDLVLRGASRLDAFSGYPVRT